MEPFNDDAPIGKGTTTQDWLDYLKKQEQPKTPPSIERLNIGSIVNAGLRVGPVLGVDYFQAYVEACKNIHHLQLEVEALRTRSQNQRRELKRLNLSLSDKMYRLHTQHTRKVEVEQLKDTVRAFMTGEIQVIDLGSFPVEG